MSEETNTTTIQQEAEAKIAKAIHDQAVAFVQSLITQKKYHTEAITKIEKQIADVEASGMAPASLAEGACYDSSSATKASPLTSALYNTAYSFSN